MKFTNQSVTVIGMKRSKGVLDNGQAFDSTKVYVLTDLDASKGDAKGQFSSEFVMGTFEEFAKFASLTFPFNGLADLEMVTNGKTTKTVITGLRAAPVAEAKRG